MRANVKHTERKRHRRRDDPEVPEKIVRVTADEARRMPSRTDWRRVRRLTDDQIAAAVASDPDAAPIFTEEMLAHVRAGGDAGPKELVSLRLDPDVIAFFRAQGRRHTSLMADVLRAYVSAQLDAAGHARPDRSERKRDKTAAQAKKPVKKPRSS